MSKTNACEDDVLDYTVEGTQPAAFTPWLALFTAAPSDAGGGTEVSGGSYARVDVSAAFSPASGGSKTNDVEVAFPQATANWGTVTHFGNYDASTGGELKRWAALTTSKAVNSGDTAKFPIGSLVFTED